MRAAARIPHRPSALRRSRGGGAANPRATNDILRDYAHRLLEEHGRLSRDLLEQAVSDDGYSVASDHADAILRAAKAELNTSRAG